jgi:transcriptional regulator with XRE-family HTH domain
MEASAVIDVLARITEYREARGWTEYQLAEKSGLPQSTISSWFRKGMMPTIPSLEKICNAFGITISQLFAREDELVALTPAQRRLLESWSRLDDEQQAAVFQLIEKM